MTAPRLIAASDVYNLSPLPTYKSASAYASLVADGASVSGTMTISFASCSSGSIAGSVLTTTGSPNAGSLSGKFEVGQTVYVAGVSQAVTITSLGTGTGGSGTYNLSGSPGNVSGVAISASTTSFSIANAAFVNADVGKGIQIAGIGTSGADLITTISAVTNGTTVVLASPPVAAIFSGRGGNYFGTITYGTDNSAAILTAHNAAVAANRRYLWIDAGTYWVGTLNGAANVIYIGEGATFLGNRRYRIIPQLTRSSYPTRSGIDPTLHLAKFKAATNPRVAFIGDSIGTPNFLGNNAIYIAQEIKQELLRKYPSKGMLFFDFAIGGCAMSDLASGSEINFAGRGLTTPYWHASGHTWMYDIQNAAWGASTPPHTVFIELGTNIVSNLGAELVALYSVITQLQALSTAPDIILLTPGESTLMSSSYWSDGREVREGTGAYLRGYCMRNGLGYLDIGRHARLLRNGQDVLNDDIAQTTITGFSGSMNLPITMPTCRDYSIQFNTTASFATTWITTSNALNFVIGNSQTPGYPTMLQVTATAGGNFAVGLFQSGNGVIFGPTDTGVAIPGSGTVYFEFSIKDTYARFAANNSNYGAGGLMPSLYEGHIERLREPFVPTIYLGNYVNQPITPTELCISTDRLVMPNMTDVEMFGSVSPSVHPTTNGQTQMYRAALENERFY